MNRLSGKYRHPKFTPDTLGLTQRSRGFLSSDTTDKTLRKVLAALPGLASCLFRRFNKLDLEHTVFVRGFYRKILYEHPL